MSFERSSGGVSPGREKVIHYTVKCPENYIEDIE